MKLKKGDKVFVIAGKDRGKSGLVSKVLINADKVVVEGINIVKKTQKASKKNPKGGIIEKSAPLAVSNIQMICPSCSKSTRIGYKILKNGTKERICKKCGQALKE